MIVALRLVTLLLLLGAEASPQQWPPKRDVPAGPADTLYYNGKIITMWDERPVVESMTVSSGRVLDVGTTQIVGRKTGPRTRQVNLQGKTVLPGLIDSHVHPIKAALAEADGEIPVLRSFEAVRRHIQAQPAGEGLIFVPKVYSTRLRERRYPDRWEIDEYAGERPVMLDNGYAAVLNSAALALAGISAGTPDPTNGKLLRNSAREPTGLIIGARQLVAPLLEAHTYSHGQMVSALAAMQSAYSMAGLTSVIDRSQTAAGFRAYQELWQQGKLQVRTSVTRVVNAERPVEQVLREIEGIGAVTGHGDETFRVGALKVVLDGGILLGTAYMRAPYGQNTQVYGFEDADYRGELRIRPGDLEQIVMLAADLGWQMTAHTTGGGSTDVLLAAYEAVNRKVPITDRRFTLTHANFLSGDAIRRAAALGVVADMQPAWYHFDGPALARVLGPDRMGTLQPYRSIIDAGVVVAGGSDHMIKFDARESVNPFDPFLGMWIAVTRTTADGSVHNPEQRITREEALRMWTLNAAYLTFEEDVKGSLEPGKYADFVVVDRDILTCAEQELRDTRVLTTMLGGREVYSTARRAVPE
ncbi:MAG: amidohydrolase [Bryobacterales bacterium]|nr:amidohydrolase [Bryobacterales bacterium]